MSMSIEPADGAALSTTEGVVVAADEAPPFDGEPGEFASDIDTPITLAPSAAAELAGIWNSLSGEASWKLLELARAWARLNVQQRSSVVSIVEGIAATTGSGEPR